MLRGNACDANLDYSCAKDANVFLDGQGHLVLRVRREPANYLGGGPYSGGWAETYAYGSGWPPSPVLSSWSVPYRIEMRVRFPTTAAAWGGGWMMNVDRNTTQEIFELDFAEQRTSFPTESLWHQHTVQNGQDVNQWHSSAVTVSDIRQNFHVWSADVYPDRVRYAVDGIPAPEIAYGASGRHGLVVNIGIGAPGTWGSGWTAPDPADPGPWDLLVDYVRVTPLP